MWRTILKCVLYTILVIVAICALLPCLFYIPAVQQGIANYAVSATSEQLGMQIELERVRVRFPLDIELENALVITASNDTMLQCRSLVLDLGFKKILKKEIEIEKLSFERTKFHYADSANTFNIKVNVDELELMARPVSLKNERAVLPDISLTGGDVILHLATAEEDTTKTKSSFDWVFEVGNLYLKDISYVMTTAPHKTSLQSAIDDACLNDAVVDIGGQSVQLSKAQINGALCKYLSAPNKAKGSSQGDGLPEENVAPWTITLDTLSLTKSNVTYGRLNYTPVKYFDPSFVSIYALNINADDIYNRASDVKVDVNHLSFYERSGFAVSHANATLVMDSSKVSLDNFNLSTLNSRIRGSVEAEASILQQDPYANLSAEMDMTLSMFDLPYFLPSISSKLPLVPCATFDVDFNLGGNLSTLCLKRFDVSSRDNFNMSLTGDVSNLMNSRPIKARASFHGELLNGALVQSFIGDKDSSNVLIPNNISFNGRVEMKGDTLRPNMSVLLSDGAVNMQGVLNMAKQYYSLSLDLTKFPLSQFVKGSSLGGITTKLNAQGLKFNPLEEGAKAKLSLNVDSLHYNRYDYRDINLDLKLSDGVYNGTIVSNSQDANLTLTMNGVLTQQKQTIKLVGDIPNLDLQKLNLSKEKMSIASSVDFSASADTVGIYSLKGGLGSTVVRMYGAKRTLPGLNLDVLADTTHVRANVEAKGLYFDFYAPVSMHNFIGGIDSVMVEVKNQNDSLRYNIDKIKSLLPECNLSLSLDNNPIVSALLKRNGITLGLTQVYFSSESNSPLYLNSRIYSFATGNISIDSICADINQNREVLEYMLSVNGVSANDVDGSSIKLSGKGYDNIFTMNCKQIDREKQVGFDFGGELLMQPQSIDFSLTTHTPILAYREFAVNDSNYISLANGKLSADFVLESGEKLVSLKTENDTTKNVLLVKLQQLDIESLLRMWPLAPKVEGELCADLGINLSAQRFGVKGDISVDSLVYEDGVVGDLKLKAGYRALEEGQQVMASLNLNKEDVVLLSGEYKPNAEESMKLNLSIESLPFASINPFIPADLLSLTGELNGKFSLTDIQNDIKMNGFLQFEDVDLTLPMIGTTFTLSPEKVTMKDNKITMYNFGLTGPNKKPMLVEGTVNLGNISETFTDFGNIISDVLITASDFQLINVKKNNKTLVYGKAFSDMFLLIQGPMNNLTLAGNVALLNGTELTYTLKDGGMAQQEDVSDLVTFTAFTDTLNVDEVEVKHNVHWGVDMSIGVSIGQAVKVAVNLTPDAKSGIDIQGGGELLYTMNMLGDTQFTGRYNIINGTVRYSLPVVATKVFTVNDGSYIEWNGDIADPTLNITAQNKVKASVNQGGVTNLVNFYVVIGIKNSLEDLDLTFDLTAPEDMTISNELASMSEDQRSEQALSMLLYDTYTGNSATSSFDANSALGSFISKELNQWANRTLKNVNLTFGVDSYTSSTGESSLDYSYEFSKSLLNDRLRVSVGGSYNPDLQPNEVAQSILGDVSLEYQLDSKDNMLVEIFRSTTNDMLEGNISEYGVGFAVRKRVVKLKELFQITGRKEKIAEKKKNKEKEKNGGDEPAEEQSTQTENE